MYEAASQKHVVSRAQLRKVVQWDPDTKLWVLTKEEALAAKLAEVPEMRTKTQAKQICGKAIEVFWDGEDQWYEAEVCSFDPATGMHVVHYRQDAYQCEERLMAGGEAEPTIWRHAVRSTARGLAAKGQAMV
jgi:hypothetical protein